MISVAASASVGERIAPSVKATAHERPSQSCATQATTQRRRRDKAERESEIGRLFVRRSRSEVKKARRVEERRQDRDEDHVRRQGDVREPRDEAEDHAAEHEQDRQRQAQSRREREQHADPAEEREELEVGMSVEAHADQPR